MPFDQHFLTALIAPRNLYIASAKQDLWSDPTSEFLNAIAVNKIYQIYGKQGIETADAYPKAGDVYHKGNIGYHLREGTHDLTRYDWHRIMEYRKLHDI